MSGQAKFFRQYICDHPGERITLPELLRITSWNREQVKSSMDYLTLTKKEFPAERVLSSSGVIGWQLLSAKPAAPTRGRRIFEEVGSFEGGAIMLRCEDGDVYSAKLQTGMRLS